MKSHSRLPVTAVRQFLNSQASAGLVLMAAAALALIVANSSLAPDYFSVLRMEIGPLSLTHWVNDGLMALFFLLVGLEIKRELVDGELSTWKRRILPGVAALGGMLVPSLIFMLFNADDPVAVRGWAIPSATDIAFALGVLSLLGKRAPASLKIFLTALAIIDDLGAVIIIALFYSGHISTLDLAVAAAVLTGLVALNRLRVQRLAPYLALGILLWLFVLRSGVHPTIAGVALAFTIPVSRRGPGADAGENSPLHRLEHGLQGWVAFLVVPVFGFANAGVSFAGISPAVLINHLTLGVAFGLLVGKLVGVFGSAYLVIRLGWARMPAGAGFAQLLGVSLLCGIGFTMSLFIGLLAFDANALLQEEVKIGILGGSFLAGLLGFALLRLAPTGPTRADQEDVPVR